eukprot:scaffold417721_cov20-Prasinocladus_malaysianus.AAC.1
MSEACQLGASRNSFIDIHDVGKGSHWLNRKRHTCDLVRFKGSSCRQANIMSNGRHHDLYNRMVYASTTRIGNLKWSNDG